MDRDALVCNKVVTVYLEKSSLDSMQHLMHCDAAKARCTEEAITDDHCLSKHAGCREDTGRTVASHPSMRLSHFASNCSSTPILVDTLEPPTMAQKGLLGACTAPIR